MSDRPTDTFYFSIDMEPETGDLQERAVDMGTALSLSRDTRQLGTPRPSAHTGYRCSFLFRPGTSKAELRSALEAMLQHLDDAQPLA